MKLIPQTTIVKEFMHTLEQIQYGSIELVTPTRVTHTFAAPNPGVKAQLVVHDWSFLNQALARGDIGLGESYIEEKWDTDSIENLLIFFLKNLPAFDSYAHGSWINRLAFNIINHVIRMNNRRGSQKNIRAHYDVGNEFYQLWLDETMTYSSALFEGKDRSLKEAQLAKYGRILGRMKEQKTLLEIGCGWGGFAESAAAQDKDLLGLTISPSQHAYAARRLGDSADIRLQDYRDTKGKFDGIVSIEMFEAVGERYWPSYFSTIKKCLSDDGKAIVQTITIADEEFEGYRTRSDFIRQYTFPGGMLPSLKRFREEAEKVGLKLQDVFTFGEDYSKTLRVWLSKMQERQNEILAMGYSRAFLRNWSFYMGMCSAAFLVQRTNVMQVELVHA